MRTIIFALAACGFTGAALARPLVIEERARIDNPDPSYPSFARNVAIDGDDALVTLHRFIPGPPESEADEMFTAVWLFRRVNGNWTPVRELYADHDGHHTIWPDGLAMQNGIAALAVVPLVIFEKRNGDWVRSSIDRVIDEPGDDVEIDQGRVLFGGTFGTWKGTLLETSPGSGAWTVTSTMQADFRSSDDEFGGGPVDLSGNHAVVLSPTSDESNDEPSVTIFRDLGPPTDFVFSTRIANSTSAPLGFETAIRGDDVFISGTNRSGTRVYRRQTGGAWPETEKLLPLDAHMGAGVTDYIKKSDLFILQSAWSADRQAFVIHVYTPSGSAFVHAATLASSRGVSLGQFAVSGRRVIAGCETQACVFELPASLTQPSPIQDTFSGASPSAWTLSSGSQFSIVPSGVSRVLRQTETASTATHAALLTASNWSNEAIEADIKPTAFNGSDRWFGLATRYRDAANHYYVTIRASGSVSLRRLVNGTFTALDSAPLAVTLNRSYRVRLESIGTRHRVYVDGRLLLEASDSNIASGRAGLLTFRAAAEFDNVMVSPTPATTLYANDFSANQVPMDVWNPSGQSQWIHNIVAGQNSVYAQGSVAGDARNSVGAPTDWQSVNVRARPTTFAGGAGGDRWFGVMARYTDEQNYYYLTLRSGNTVSLRKLTDGAIGVLATAPLTVTLGTWYSLRLEAIGSRLRGYVNGNLVLEATDTTHSRGEGGLVMYRTAAQFDDYRAVQP